MFGPHADPMAQAVLNAANIAFFGTKEPSPELLDATSPALHVTKNAPPTFLWATTADALVPIEHSTRMATALASAGIPFEIHIFENGQHGLSLANQATAGSVLDMDADAAHWIDLVEAWLKKRFALSVPAKPAWLEALEAGAH
ncbi:MAG: prolyl oligopeptidase family serine peptidase [Anaerolineae bacterium]